MVVMVGIIFVVLDPRIGMVNQILGLVGAGPIDFMGNASYFRHIFVWSGVWQTSASPASFISPRCPASTLRCTKRR